MDGSGITAAANDLQVIPLVTGIAIALGLDYDIFLVSRQRRSPWSPKRYLPLAHVESNELRSAYPSQKCRLGKPTPSNAKSSEFSYEPSSFVV